MRFPSSSAPAMLGLALLGAGLLLLPACTEPSPDGATGGDTTAASSVADTAAAAPDTLTVARTDTVPVKLSGFTIDMPTSLRTGPTVFRVRNIGQQQHSFGIIGKGVEHVFNNALPPGRTRSMKMNLRPGTYKIYCPMENHAGRGMERKLTVEGSDASA